MNIYVLQELNGMFMSYKIVRHSYVAYPLSEHYMSLKNICATSINHLILSDIIMSGETPNDIVQLEICIK